MAINLLEIITPLQCFSQLYSSVMQAYVFWSLFCQGTLKHVVEVNIVQSETIFAYSGADCTASCWCENTIGTVQQAKLHHRVLHRDMHFAKVLTFFSVRQIEIDTCSHCANDLCAAHWFVIFCAFGMKFITRF